MCSILTYSSSILHFQARTKWHKNYSNFKDTNFVQIKGSYVPPRTNASSSVVSYQDCMVYSAYPNSFLFRHFDYSKLLIPRVIVEHEALKQKEKKKTILHFINEFNTSMPFSLPVFKSNLVLLALKNIIKYSLLGLLCLIGMLGRTILVQLYLHISLYIIPHFHSSSSPKIVRPRKALLCVLEKAVNNSIRNY